MEKASTITTVQTVPSSPVANLVRTASFHQPQPGLLVTKELDKAIASCKAKVERIAKDCKAKNRKFRDIEFDLENDKHRCLFSLFSTGEKYAPADVHRVTQIFEKPQFFADGKISSHDIIQGALGDCWFLSALATVSTAPRLVEKFCVARDEKVGVYGFIFFKDNAWVTVLIDDMLYTRVPKWEELRSSEQELYHFDKEIYNKSARKGGKTLYFARSGTTGDTWVPLIEKAYAKLHGNYSHLSGGEECDAIEDLTGGVSTVLRSKDILGIDRFWNEELTRATKGRLFGCSFDDLSSDRSGISGAKVQGLIGNHSYSVLRALACHGKRFVVLRNPWGNSEWTGKWSDGSKEWTQEWLPFLTEMGHEFGDDGQFVMEYTDWLDCFSHIDRTVLFDETWSMSSQWLQVTCPPLPTAWSFGEVSFKFSLSGPTAAVIVLSQLERRHYRDISGHASWTMDFCLVKEGEEDIIAESAHSDFYQRSVHLEADLDEGDYIVYVRLDRTLDRNEAFETVDEWQLRTLSRLLTQRAKSQSIASNAESEEQKFFLPPTLEELIKKDMKEYKTKQKEKAVVVTTKEESVDENGAVTTTTTTTTTKVETVVVKKGTSGTETETKAADKTLTLLPTPSYIEQTTNGATTPVYSSEPEPTIAAQRMRFDPPPHENNGDTPKPPPQRKVVLPQESNDKVVIGLRVYTNKDVKCAVEGRLKTGCKDPNCINCTHPTTLTYPATTTEMIATTIVTAA